MNFIFYCKFYFTFREYKLKVRYINPCDSREIPNKKYVAIYNISVKTFQTEEEIYGTVTVPYTQKVIKVNSFFIIWYILKYLKVKKMYLNSG